MERYHRDPRHVGHRETWWPPMAHDPSVASEVASGIVQAQGLKELVEGRQPHVGGASGVQTYMNSTGLRSQITNVGAQAWKYLKGITKWCTNHGDCVQLVKNTVKTGVKLGVNYALTSAFTSAGLPAGLSTAIVTPMTHRLTDTFSGTQVAGNIGAANLTITEVSGDDDYVALTVEKPEVVEPENGAPNLLIRITANAPIAYVSHTGNTDNMNPGYPNLTECHGLVAVCVPFDSVQGVVCTTQAGVVPNELEIAGLRNYDQVITPAAAGSMHTRLADGSGQMNGRYFVGVDRDIAPCVFDFVWEPEVLAALVPQPTTFAILVGGFSIGENPGVTATGDVDFHIPAINARTVRDPGLIPKDGVEATIMSIESFWVRGLEANHEPDNAEFLTGLKYSAAT